MRWIVVLVWLSACDCGETSPRVPFKLTRTEQPSAEGAVPAPAQGGQGAQYFDKPVDHPKIDGMSTPFLAARSVLALDLDSDQDRDAIAIVSSAEEVVSLAFAAREEAAFGPAAVSAGFGLQLGCEATSLALAVLSSTKGVMSVESSCTTTKLVQPRRELLFAVDAKPYLLERLEIWSAEAGEPALALTFGSQDSDADAHDDVLIDARLTFGDATLPVSERVVLLDRGPSLAFDAASFESALRTRAERAKSLLRKAPTDAANEAFAVVALHTALCRDSTRARVGIAGRRGLPCTPSAALARALATWIATQATKNQLVPALDAYVALSQLDPRDAKQPLADAARALAALKPRVDITLTAGPAVSESSAPMLRLPSARFVTDNLLFVRRDAPVVFDIDHATEVAAPSADDRILDPAGSLAVTGIERRCSGLFLRIERAAQASEPSPPARPVSTPALLPLDPQCSDTAQTRRHDTGGYRVLGWAPQGVLLARGSEVRLVPLSIDGAASGEPRTLDALTARPAPLPLGRASSDGSRYAWLAPFGVVIMDTSGKAELWRPKGWEQIAAQASDVAISPSGQRVAVTSSGRAHVLSSVPVTTGRP